MIHEADLDDELTPPSAERVAKRALVLASCACRAYLEDASNDPGARDMHFDVMRWAEDVGILNEFEPTEWAAVSKPLGELSERQQINLGWMAEGLAMLAWALNRFELPDYDWQADGPSIGGAIGFLQDDARELIESAALRPRADLEWLADLTLALHWRLREYSLRPAALDFIDFASNCKWASFPIDDLRINENDLELRGQALHDCPEAVIRECLSIATERHLAANWLIGTETVYSRVTTDT